MSDETMAGAAAASESHDDHAPPEMRSGLTHRQPHRAPNRIPRDEHRIATRRREPPRRRSGRRAAEAPAARLARRPEPAQADGCRRSGRRGRRDDGDEDDDGRRRARDRSEVDGDAARSDRRGHDERAGSDRGLTTDDLAETAHGGCRAAAPRGRRHPPGAGRPARPRSATAAPHRRVSSRPTRANGSGNGGGSAMAAPGRGAPRQAPPPRWPGAQPERRWRRPVRRRGRAVVGGDRQRGRALLGLGRGLRRSSRTSTTRRCNAAAAGPARAVRPAGTRWSCTSTRRV